MVVMWIVFVIFAGMSALLLSGKGGFLIAGYNTLSEKQKAKYNEKKMCRIVGAGMLVITIMLFIMALFGENIPDSFWSFFTLITLVDVVVMMYLTNKKCYAENIKVENEKEEGKEKNIAQKISIVITIVTCLIVGIICFTGDIQIEYHEESFTIKASYWNDKEINYSDIESIEYCTSDVTGSRTNGFGSPRLQMGKFKNSEFGSYTRYSYTKCEESVVLTIDGKTLVISGKDEAATKEIYETLLTKM